MSLPPSVTNGKDHAVILPIFFYLLKQVVPICREMNVCISMYAINYIVFLLFRGIDLIPENKTDLISCLHSNICRMRKKYIRTHVSDYVFYSISLLDLCNA